MRNAITGGTLTFRIPYDGRVTFDWRLDSSGHDVIVECIKPWKGLHTDVHRIGMGPKFTSDEARRQAEELARRIIGNLDYVVRNRDKDSLGFVSVYDNKQLPLYRKWAWEEEKRRFVEVGLLTEAFKDDDDDDSPEGVVSAEYEERAEEELKSVTVELIEEKWGLA